MKVLVSQKTSQDPSSQSQRDKCRERETQTRDRGLGRRGREREERKVAGDGGRIEGDRAASEGRRDRSGL